MTHLNKKSVLVTGCCGTVGKELVRQLTEEYAVGELIGLDNNESELFFLQQRYQQQTNVTFFLADIRDRYKLIRMFQGVHIVFHAAAFKHVVLCERSPFEAVQTNINGVQNVIEAAYESKVERVIFTSSDKAVNPTNVMGTSKLMGEKLMTAASSESLKGSGTVFASTRFGNVLGSRGSVIPVFHEQIRRGGPVTLTDPEMTRFIMSIKEATRLVIDSSILAKGGEIFVTKMPAIRILNLAEVMIQQLAPVYGYRPDAIEVVTIGAKPGEKFYEELMNSEETRRTYELKNYFAVIPAFGSISDKIEYDYPDILSLTVEKPYNSNNEKPLSQKELTDFLLGNQLLEADLLPQNLTKHN
ncbi:MAG: polysaccharide biosynthesis protein [Okeania sp. SIO2C2]|uniref:SDR family NAD(P)-dependent oxidoreductase n=1 Tax=Okeania sp. SIO2C2 TaxID=2607787 RepID=UPI0013BBF024|nr:SDR family NAD(P)-dependent oxidoreductase [Okeania sp. SIO2C2]NEP91296.1 polysaccharide biosynthesis protein [Okeania sp. SIO2C2]